MKIKIQWVLVLACLLCAPLTPALAGCMCKNYSGAAFCAESILSCQAQAGNCMEACEWHKSDVKKKKPANEGNKKKSMLIF